MCNCLEEIAKDYSESYFKNGKNARVNLTPRCEVYVRQYVLTKKNAWTGEEGKIQISKKGTYYSAKFKFCPICGEKYSKEPGLIYID